jgi:hypothetical protein
VQNARMTSDSGCGGRANMAAARARARHVVAHHNPRALPCHHPRSLPPPPHHHPPSSLPQQCGGHTVRCHRRVHCRSASIGQVSGLGRCEQQHTLLLCLLLLLLLLSSSSSWQAVAATEHTDRAVHAQLPPRTRDKSHSSSRPHCRARARHALLPPSLFPRQQRPHGWPQPCGTAVVAQPPTPYRVRACVRA